MRRRITIKIVIGFAFFCMVFMWGNKEVNAGCQTETCKCGCASWASVTKPDGSTCCQGCKPFYEDTQSCSPSGGGGGGGGGTSPTAGPTPTPQCTPQPFSKASVAPSTLRPYDQVTVRCNYGKRLDCLSVTGAGLANCRYSRYEGTDNIFACEAGQNAGYYDDAKCVLSAGTADKCCASSNTLGSMNIIGTEVHYDQDIVLPFGNYTLSARVFSVIANGKGVRVSLICNSATCANGMIKNAEVASIPFLASGDFVTSAMPFPLIGTGDDRHYLLRISADKGSEAYFDWVSLKNTAQRELVVNGDFANTINGSVSTKQPTAWGEGDNKIGYYYGSLTDGNGGGSTGGGEIIVPGTTPGVQPTSGPTPTPGPAASMSLNLKIKLQLITKKPTKSDPINVQVKLGGGGLASPTAYKSFQFSVNDAGEWSGKAAFDSIPTGGGYRIYIKGPKHIAKKICDATPTEGKGGEYHCGDGKIVLQAGENTFDFSKIIQLAGDLPEAGGKQNGIIDAYDTTFIRTNLGSTDAAKAAIGDLNLDGGIDTQDYSMILQSLNIKYDEE